MNTIPTQTPITTMSPPPQPAPASDSNFRSRTLVLVDDGNLKATVKIDEFLLDPKKTEHLGSNLTLETGDAADRIHISQRPDGKLSVKVNDKEYSFDGDKSASAPSSSKDKPSPPFSLNIKTAGGNDTITLDPNVSVTVKIEAGDGDDTIQAGGGVTDIYGGRGNDHIRLGRGISYAEGNEGDDTMIGGTGDSVMYGNQGKDRLYAGAGAASKTSHLDGGDGDDQLYAGNGHTVINGGRGNDRIIAHDDTVIYTGKGSDTVWANGSKARIYAKGGDRLLGTEHSTITRQAPSDAGRKAFKIQGTDAFKQRVEDDLELLRASPAGRKMLEEMDNAAQNNGAPVTIEQSEANMYRFNTRELNTLSMEDRNKIKLDDPKVGGLKDGVPGARADQGRLFYNPSLIHVKPDPTAPELTSPIVQFYHEMAHAWNGANGTLLEGTSKPSPDHPERPGPPNMELQAVGLPTDAPPFDFDNDPSTPPTSTNPAPFTENALRAEMGRPARTKYA
ncbi:hemolysin [Pseudomonas cedrina subsp. cedrina]|uniref:Hemolysin n=1 Tax=Pseudomonas cedrina subsp. cedrina TaxID=76762 RepID=A0A1V2KG55_PSECE|nr:hemolysin [Pseudomonas cedrina subsp. cedrina]